MQEFVLHKLKLSHGLKALSSVVHTQGKWYCAILDHHFPITVYMILLKKKKSLGLIMWHEKDTTVREQPDDIIIRNKLGSLLLGYHLKTNPRKSMFEC